MNLKNLSKEQKQKYILLAVISVAGLFAVKQFALSPLLASHAKAVEELEQLKGKVESADALIKRADEITQQAADVKLKLEAAARERIPAVDNPLAWATRGIYAHARALGVDLESVSDLEVDAQGFTAKEQEKRTFKPYGVRVVTQCSFEQLRQLIQALESSNPYVSVSGINIGSQPNTPERHQIMFNLEWPSWKNPQKSVDLLHDPKTPRK